MALGKAKKFPEMQAELKKAAELDPPKAGQYYYNLGAMLVNAGQSEPAGQAFKKAIELDPKHADSYYQLGVHLIGKASIRGRRQSAARAGNGGSIPEVPGTGSRRAVRRLGERHAGLDGCEGGYLVQESQRGASQEEKVV